jgi:hypothetical protein
MKQRGGHGDEPIGLGGIEAGLPQFAHALQQVAVQPNFGLVAKPRKVQGHAGTIAWRQRQAIDRVTGAARKGRVPTMTKNQA